MDKSEQSNGTTNHAVAIRHDDYNAGLTALNLLDDKQLAAAEVFLKKIIASPKGGITNVNDGLAILMRANDLQLPFSTCIEHIHVVNNKTTADIHIIKSLLSRAGVTWECTKDYAPQYQYTDGNTIYLDTQLPDYCVRCRNSKDAEDISASETTDLIGVYPLKFYADLNNNIYNQFGVSDKCVIALNIKHAQKLKQEGKFPVIRIPAQPVDWVTEYKFTRYKLIAGKYREITCKSHFSYSEAQAADFFTKDTYKKYARIMIGHRAFTLGARDIASDLLMGVLEESERAIMDGDDYSISDADYIEEISQ